MRDLYFMRFTVQSAIWGLLLVVCVSGVSAQYSSFTANYAQQPALNGEEMTVGEMLADQEIAERKASQGRAVPVTMTGYSQNANSQVSQANYETTPPTQAGMNAYSVHQTTVSEPVTPPTPVSVPANSPVPNEPQQFPEDFPTGEMASLNPQSLISFSEVVTLPEGPFQQVTIIDPSQKAICVYHINMGTGQIELKSARKIEWDLQLIFLNSKKPLPQDVQAILQQTKRRK